MNGRVFRRRLIRGVIAVLVILAVAQFVQVGRKQAGKMFSPYMLKQESVASRYSALAETRIGKLESESDVFIRAMNAVDALSLLTRCIVEEPDFPVESAIEPMGVHTLTEFESMIVVPLKNSAGAGKDPLVDATFSWLKEAPPGLYSDIPRQFISMGKRDRARAVLEQAFLRIGTGEWDYSCDPEGSDQLSELVDTCIELGQTNLAYHFIPNLLVSEMRSVGYSLSDACIPMELAGIYRKLGRRDEAIHYYDLAYGFLLREAAEQESAAWRSSFFDEMFHPMRRRNAYWHKYPAVSITRGYIELGETSKAEQVIPFITDHVVSDPQMYSNNYWIPEIASVFDDCGRHERAKELLQEGAEYLLKRGILDDVHTPAQMVLWYAEHDYELEARQLVERTALAIPLSDGFTRDQFAKSLIERELDRFIPIVLSPMTEEVLHHDYSADKYRVYRLLGMAKLYHRAGFMEEAQALFDSIETGATELEEVDVKIKDLDELAGLLVDAGDKEAAMRVLDLELRLINGLPPADPLNAFYARAAHLYVKMNEFERATVSLEQAAERINAIELIGSQVVECLARMAVDYYAMQLPDVGSRLLNQAYEKAMGMTGSGNVEELIVISMLMAGPLNPDALECWD